MDWERWQPTDRATLLFVLDESKILLIRKKRGLGAGKISAPGGRMEPGESPLQCALRELKEEVGVTAFEAAERGLHHFQFMDGYALKVHVFITRRWSGEPVETDEAIPLWFDVAALPYEEMWEDDRLWMPHLLAGRSFVGWYLFDGDSMLQHRLELQEMSP
ncbi:MAG: NUDIX hydrolase [Rickettsiales bacterium]|nr:NUDIX hydrolase [Rickettsiales bacterium]